MGGRGISKVQRKDRGDFEREREKEEERCLILLYLFYNKRFGNFLLTRTQGLGYNLEFFFTTFNFGAFPDFTGTQFFILIIFLIIYKNTIIHNWNDKIKDFN